MGKANNKSPFIEKAHTDIPHVFGYVAGLESTELKEAMCNLSSLAEPTTGEYGWMAPQLMLAMVDQLVLNIERTINDRERFGPWYGRLKFTMANHAEDIPWMGAKSMSQVFEKNIDAFSCHATMRGFYNLLSIPEWRSANYCVSIEAAREALLAVYPNDFPGLPRQERFETADLEAAKVLAKQFWPQAERFNSLLDKILEIVGSRGYRSKKAREKTKLKDRARSVRSLINGLLAHHKSLTVVAVRLSIRQCDASHRVGEKAQQAFARIMGDRRNDELLSEAIGFFWVLQESFAASFRQRRPTTDIRNPLGHVALHYDLVLFFKPKRSAEAVKIVKYIGASWNHFAGEGAFHRTLNGDSFRPYEKTVHDWEMEKDGLFPGEYEFTGLVHEQSLEARNLRRAAYSMVYAAAFRKPRKQSQSPTLIKNRAHRFGKSDLLTGCGFDKAGRGNKLGRSAVKHERKKRPKYSEF